MVEHPVSQHVAGKKGVFNIDLVERKSLTAQEFKEIAAQCTDGEPQGTPLPIWVVDQRL